MDAWANMTHDGDYAHNMDAPGRALVDREYGQYLRDYHDGGPRADTPHQHDEVEPSWRQKLFGPVVGPTRLASHRTAWSGWGPKQFPKRHTVAGWDWDEHLSGYVSKGHRRFACDCGQEHDVPGYGTCKCGKLWNRYVIGTGSDTRTAAPEMFIAREIPVRDGVIVASRRTADAGQQLFVDPSSFQGQFARDIADGVPDTPEQARYVNWYNRWKNMTKNEAGQYRPGPEVVGWQDYHAARRLAAEADSAAYVEGEFQDWLMSQGDSLEALRQNPRALQSKLDEFTAQRGHGDDPAELMQYMSAFTGYDDEAPEPFRAQRDVQRSRQRADPTKGLGWAARGMDDDQLGHATFTKHAAPTWYNPTPQGNGINVEVLHGPGWWASTDPKGSWTISREDASPLASGQAGGPTEAKGVVEDHLRRVKAPGFVTAAMPPMTKPWSGKTPGGPQGPGVEGLKQKTRYKGYSTPYLRALHQRMMTTQNASVDWNELLRELSFREVLGALHDLDAPGGTPAEEGSTDKRTDPTMSAPVDWSRRRSDGKWTRGDGHVTARLDVEVPA